MRALAFATAISLAGCWSSASAPPITPRPPPADLVVASGDDATYRRAIDDPLGFLPASANVVMGIEVAALRDSAIWQHYAAQLEHLVKLDTLVDPACRALYDTMESFTFGLDVRDPDAPSGVLVMRGIDLAGTKTCLARTADTTVRTLAGNRRIATETKNATTGGITSRAIMQWVDVRTCVAAVGKAVTEADLDRALASPDAVRRGGGELGAAADGLIGGGAHAMWAAMVPAGSAATQLASLGIPAIQLVSGSIDATDAVVVDAHARLPTAQDATDFVQKYSGNLSSMKMFLARIDLTAADRDVVLDVRATQANIDGLVNLFGGGGSGGTTPPTPPTP